MCRQFMSWITAVCLVITVVLAACSGKRSAPAKNTTGETKTVIGKGQSRPAADTRKPPPSMVRSAVKDPKAACVAAGGKVTTAECCKSVRRFPNLCHAGPCG